MTPLPPATGLDEAARAALRALWARAADPPLSADGHPAEPGALPLAAALTVWDRRLDRQPGTVGAVREALAQLAEFTHTTPATRLSVPVMEALRQFLFGPGDLLTLGERLALLRALQALDADADADADADDANGNAKAHAHAVVAVRQMPPPRAAFSAAELTRLWADPLFAAHRLPAAPAAAGEAAYWLPLLVYAATARLGEAASLMREDAGWSAGPSPVATLCLGERHAKTAGPRVVPVHPALLARGWASFVESVPAGTPLFPGLQATAAERAHGMPHTARFSRWFSHFLRHNVGLTTPSLCLHSLRQSFACACQASAMPAPVQAALFGRAAAREGATWDVPLDLLRHYLARVSLPGLPA